MRVSIIINSKAGSVNPELIKKKIGEALFRCDLHFCEPNNIDETSQFMETEINERTSALVICGGDGTINICLQTLLKFQKDKRVPICIIRSGTANDLAHELGVSQRIDLAARSILEGKIKTVDLIEITHQNGKNVMISNGGLGIPTLAAEYSNLFRESFRNFIESSQAESQFLKTLGTKSYSLVKKMGPTIYSIMAIYAIQAWKSQSWKLQITLGNGNIIQTHSPIILVNNQPSIGSNFTPAPYTSNTDGFINLLIAKSQKIFEHLIVMQKLKSGEVFDKRYFEVYETPSFELKILSSASKERTPSFTFFGDGELLIHNTQEIKVKCLHQELPIYIQREY